MEKRTIKTIILFGLVILAIIVLALDMLKMSECATGLKQVNITACQACKLLENAGFLK